MGVRNLKRKMRRWLNKRVKLKKWKGKKVGIDASVWIHQALRRKDGNFKQFFLIRIKNLINQGIVPVFVFDGKPPIAKSAELEKRRRTKSKDDANEQNQDEDSSDNDDVLCELNEDATRYQRMEEELHLDKSSVAETIAPAHSKPRLRATKVVKKLLRELNIEYVQAFAEADYQLVLMELMEYTAATISIDTDMIVLGSENLIFDFFLDKGCVYTHKIFKKAWKKNFSRKLLCPLAVMMGGDYLPGGLKGFGEAAARKVFKEQKRNCDQMDAQETSSHLLSTVLSNGNYKTDEDFEVKYTEAVQAMMYHPVFKIGTKELRPFIQDDKGTAVFEQMVKDGDDEFNWDDAHFEPKGECTIKASPFSDDHLVCPVCDEILKSADDYDAHRNEKHLVPLDPCLFCKKSFGFASHLETHLLSHIQEKPYFCTNCDKEFRTRQQLQIHERTHSGDRPFKCGKCGKKFADPSNLIIHERTHLGERPFKCEKCGKGFTTRQQLQIHQLTHSGDRPFKCETCGKGFTTRQHLQIHERTHSGDRPFKCGKCGKKFADPSNLIIHERTHLGERPFKCETCGKGFTTRHHLQAHETTHSVNKPYECKTCGKKFNRASNLRVHERIHSGSRPYKCKTCSKGFTNSSDLRRHEKTHLGKKNNKH